MCTTYQSVPVSDEGLLVNGEFDLLMYRSKGRTQVTT